MASNTVLVVPGPFAGRLGPASVASAIGRGLSAEADWELDASPLAEEGEQGEARALLDAVNFDARMRAAHAVVVAEQRLSHELLRGSAAFEIATRARQAGVPCYAITTSNELDLFEARILDLQLVLEASNERAFEAAARKLAKLL